MKYLQLLLLLLVGFFLHSCTDESYEKVKLNTFEIASDSIGETYPIEVFVSGNADEDYEYPLIVLLDGEWYTQDVADWLAAETENGNLPPCILVGIRNNAKRARDFTPWHDEEEKTSGGAPDYLSFLEYELIPYMESNYSVNSKMRILAGHSYGGLFATWAMLETADEPVFSAILAASPSLYFADGEIFKLSNALIEDEAKLDMHLVITVGGDEGLIMNALAREMFTDLLSNAVMNGRMQLFQYEKESHIEAALPAFKDGIQFMLNANYDF